jgi:Cu(I)/Ag(I) efflux system membrane fusion protein
VTVREGAATVWATVSKAPPFFDPATRTLKLRLEADNPGFALRPDMFVDLELPIRSAPALTIPIEALMDSGLTERVFVERSEGKFEPRVVETGWRSTERVEVVSGLKEGERIVASGTFLVDSESQLKAPAGAVRP